MELSFEMVTGLCSQRLPDRASAIIPVYEKCLETGSVSFQKTGDAVDARALEWSDSYRCSHLRVQDPRTTQHLSVVASVCHLPLRPTGSDHSEGRLTRVIGDMMRKVLRQKARDSPWWLRACVQWDGVTVETITRLFSRQRRELSDGTPLIFSQDFSFEREDG